MFCKKIKYSCPKFANVQNSNLPQRIKVVIVTVIPLWRVPHSFPSLITCSWCISAMSVSLLFCLKFYSIVPSFYKNYSHHRTMNSNVRQTFTGKHRSALTLRFLLRLNFCNDRVVYESSIIRQFNDNETFYDIFLFSLCTVKKDPSVSSLYTWVFLNPSLLSNLRI